MFLNLCIPKYENSKVELQKELLNSTDTVNTGEMT